MEILTGVERRRDWSDDEKLSILQEAADPDARIADVARRHDIKPQQIYTWRRKFSVEKAEPVVLSCLSLRSRRDRATKLSDRLRQTNLQQSGQHVPCGSRSAAKAVAS
jgi:transposase-like protein